jgi:predicted phage baseplate assembly protein
VRVTEVRGERTVTEDWVEVTDFSMSGPEDRHVVWDDSEGRIVFGPAVHYPDGTMVHHGAVPKEGALIEVSSYRYGGGLHGNLDANTITNLYTSIPYVARVANRTPSTGGVEAETVDNVKVRGPMTLRTGQRAVTTSDFERLTLQNTQVARARCLRPKQPGGPVKVLVVPAVDKPDGELVIDDFVLRDHLYHAVAEYLDERRVLGTVVEVTTPYYVGVSVAALVRAAPGRPAKSVEDPVLARLDEYLSPLHGGPDGAGWPWDTPLTTASLQAVLTEVPGVVSVDDVVLFAVDLRNGQRLGEAVQSMHLDERSLLLGFKHQVVVK